jgi:ABC-type phosphate transport system permease subunit
LILLVCAISSIFAIFLIIVFVFSQGVPFLAEAGLPFLTGSVWLGAFGCPLTASLLARGEYSPLFWDH